MQLHSGELLVLNKNFIKGYKLVSYEWSLLIITLIVYALVSLLLWGSFETHYDSPGYTDPAISFIMGKGFSSGCWYFQGDSDFWAGNVPLHQFLLIPWMTLFNLSVISVRILNMIYIIISMILLWMGMRRSGLLQTPTLRIGALWFFLLSDSACTLFIAARPEPLCLLIISLAWYFFTSTNFLERYSR